MTDLEIMMWHHADSLCRMTSARRKIEAGKIAEQLSSAGRDQWRDAVIDGMQRAKTCDVFGDNLPLKKGRAA